jgi:hypothetical protein
MRPHFLILNSFEVLLLDREGAPSSDLGPVLSLLGFMGKRERQMDKCTRTDQNPQRVMC